MKNTRRVAPTKHTKPLPRGPFVGFVGGGLGGIPIVDEWRATIDARRRIQIALSDTENLDREGRYILRDVVDRIDRQLGTLFRMKAA